MPSVADAAVMVSELAASADAPPGVWVLVLGQRVVPQPGTEQRDDLKAPGPHYQDAGFTLWVPHHVVGIAQAVAGHIREEDDIRAIACRKALDIPRAASDGVRQGQAACNAQTASTACRCAELHGTVNGHAV